MKKCGYCGKDYPDEIIVCEIDGSALIANLPMPPMLPEAEAVRGMGLTSLQKRGRVMLAVLLSSWLSIALGIIILDALFSATLLPLACARLVLTFGLFYAVWIGKHWARWLTVALFAFAFLLSVRGFVGHLNVFSLLFTVSFLALLLMFAFVLVVSNAVSAFLAYQRSRRGSASSESSCTP